MAGLLSPSNLEDTPTGTINTNAIFRANWAKINDTLDPTHTGSQAGLIQAAIAGQATLTTITYGASVNCSLLASPVQVLVLAGDVTIAVTNKNPGRRTTLIITADGTDRTITWPVGAVWAGPVATGIAAGTSLAITIHSTTTADAGLILSLGGIAYTAGSGINLTAGAFSADSTIARLASPALSGIPTAPTATVATNTDQLATTAFVVAEIAASITGTVTLTGTQTLTNKTLTAPTITAGIIQATTLSLAAGAYVEITASRAVTDADNGKVLWSTGAWTLTFPDSLTKPFSCTLKTEAANKITVAASGTAVIVNLDGHTGTAALKGSFAAIDYRTGNDVYLTGRTS